METVRKFQDWAGPAVWVMMLILAIVLSIKAGGISFGREIPPDVLIKKTADAGVPFAPGSFAALAAVAATWITYFSALYLNFCDFSRFAPDKKAVRTGNIWGLPVNLILFSFVAGITTTAAYAVYHEVLLHPDEISARFDSWFLALLAALTFAVATLGINVVANFVSPAFDFANVFPSMIDFKKGGYIAALIALVLYPFAPWEGSAASFVGIIGSTMGPIFGVIMVDYYLIRNGEVDVPALYQRGRRSIATPADGTSTRSSPPRSAPSSPASCRTSPASCRRGGESMAGSSGSRSAARSITPSSRCAAPRPPAPPARPSRACCAYVCSVTCGLWFVRGVRCAFRGA